MNGLFFGGAAAALVGMAAGCFYHYEVSLICFVLGAVLMMADAIVELFFE